MRFFIKRNNFKVARRCLLLAVTLIIMILAVAPVSAQEKPGDSALTARSVFERISAPALELLRPSSRLDMLDYWDADSVYHAKNAFNGESWLETVTPDHLRLRITPVSTFDIKLLPVKGGEVVMTLYTVGGEGQARDTSVDFYDAATLLPLDASAYFTPPSIESFITIPKGSPLKMRDVKELIPFVTVEYTLDPGSDQLSATLTADGFLSTEASDIIKPLMHPSLKSAWKNQYKFK